MEKYYITTPIYYVNSEPHIGHAYTSVLCDIFARFARLKSMEVKFLTGTDEHGQKVEKAAIDNNMAPKDFVERIVPSFKKLLVDYNINNNDFIRTTEERHRKSVAAIWDILVKNNFIYLGKYSGWYAEKDEAFYKENEIDEQGKAPTGAPVEWLETPSYFFALSKLQNKLLYFYKHNPDFIYPKSKLNEITSFVEGGLEDLSVSRTNFTWGIKVPNDSEHVIYVWIDALTNYISALGYPNYNKSFWKNAIHVIGKDILKFHAIYWPAMLIAADIPLPKNIIVHGWWIKDGEKMSKSLGNVINPFDLVKEFGPDMVRYFLARYAIIGNDSDFNRENFISLINSELVNKIGNLVQRSLVFIQKFNDSQVPKLLDSEIDALYLKETILQNCEKLSNKLVKDFEEYNLHLALDFIVELTDQANAYMENTTPWKLKNDKKSMQNILYVLLEVIRYLAVSLTPFTPEGSNKILDMLLIDKSQRMLHHLNRKYSITTNVTLPKPEIIFIRLE